MTTSAEAWAAFVDGLRQAGERLAADVAGLDEVEQADGFRALVRALNNQLGRFEVDRERPELVAFNGWREKMFMDNPDFRYWVADVRDDRRYRITGTMGAALYLSITAYASSGALSASASARLDSDSLTIDDAGRFSVVLGGEQAAAGGDDWLELPEGASALWVRQFHLDARHDDLGDCAIEPLDEVPLGPPIDPGRFAHQLGRLGQGVAFAPAVFAASTKDDRAHPNEVRPWSEMAGGAAFTEPNIHYLRGSWDLGPDDALVIDGELPECRYWNALLYSRFLNSLDHRSRTVSRTAASARIVDGRYRLVLAGRDPGPGHDWLDTEGRSFGLVVLRFLQPTTPPAVPEVRIVPVDALGAGR